jgi:nicotinamidase-related amidase
MASSAQANSSSTGSSKAQPSKAQPSKTPPSNGKAAGGKQQRNAASAPKPGKPASGKAGQGQPAGNTPAAQAAAVDRREVTPGSATALLLIDVINDLAFDGGEDLKRQALPMAPALADLKQRAKAAGIPVIYVNDNFNHWQSDFHRVVEYCLRPEAPGRETTALLQPDEDDYFVIKPRHSGFYQTNLSLLLTYLDVHTLILTGMAADMCVLFTANDAYLRGYQVIVPPDGCAAEQEEYRAQALALMQRALKADLTPCAALDLAALYA